MPTVEQMRIVMDADTARMVNGMRAADRYLAQFVQNAEKRLNRLDAFTRRAGMAFGAIGAGLGAREVLEYANAWTRVERTLVASEDAFGISLDSSARMVDLANEARVDVESFTKTYVRAAAAIRDYGYDSDVAAKVTSTLAKALKLGSASANEQASVLLQFSQALQKGKLDGDEFRTIMENAGIVQELLAKRLNVTKGEIISMAAAGQLKIPQLIGAMTEGADQIDRIFRQMPQTVDESFVVLRNAVIQYVGDVDRATGATSALSGAIGSLARNIEPIADLALTIGAGLVAAFTGPAVRGIVSFGVGAAKFVPPLKLVAFLAGSAASAISLFGNDAAQTAIGVATLSDTAQAFVNVTSTYLAPAMDAVSAAWVVAVDIIKYALQGGAIAMDDLAAVVRKALNSTIGLFVAAGRVIRASFLGLPEFVGEQIINAINVVVENVEAMLRKVVDGLNMLPGVQIEPPDLGRFENAFVGAGARLATELSGVAGDMSRDYVGIVGGAVASVGAEIEKETQRLAALRQQASWAGGTKSIAGSGRIAPPAIDEKLAREMERAAEQIARLQTQALQSSGAYRMAVQLEYDRDLAGFKAMLDEKIITQQQFEQARAALAEIAARDMAEATEREFEKLRAVTDAVVGGMERAFDDFVEGGKFSFSQFASSVIADIARIALRMMVLEPLFGGGRDGGLGAIGSAIAGAFGGFRADGGPVSPGKAYVVGERGRELFMPRTAGTIVPNDALAGGAGGMSVNLTINAPNATPDAVRQLEARIPGIVLTAIREANSRRMA